MREVVADLEGPVAVDAFQPAAEIEALGFNLDADLAELLLRVFGKPYERFPIGNEVLGDLEPGAVRPPTIPGFIEQLVGVGDRVFEGPQLLVVGTRRSR